MLNRSASLAMSTSVLKALPCKLDIKRHSPSILYLSQCLVQLSNQLMYYVLVSCFLSVKYMQGADICRMSMRLTPSSNDRLFVFVRRSFDDNSFLYNSQTTSLKRSHYHYTVKLIDGYHGYRLKKLIYILMQAGVQNLLIK